MSESFDPYYTWLGIPPSQQPPNHYRLLGIEALEGNLDVIESAADQRMAHLRSFQTGKRGHLTQKLLNEVAAAKVCLLDPKKKAEYDASLRAKQAAQENDAVEADVFTSLAEAATAGRFGVGQRPSRRKRNVALIASTTAAGAIVLIAACIFLSRMFLSDKKTSDDSHRLTRVDVAEKQNAAGQPDALNPVGQASSLPETEAAPKNADEPNPVGQASSLPKLDAPPASSPPVSLPSPEPAKQPTPPQPPAPAAQPPAGEPSATPSEEPKKHPIPSAETQRGIGGTIEDAYKLSQAKTPEAKLQLAKELSGAAQKTTKPDEQYVLLRKAVDLACDGGDAALMLETIGPMTEAFAIDPLVAKSAMLERFAKGPRSPARVQSLAEGSRGVIEEALADDRYEIASNLARTVADACSRSTPQVRKEAADRRKRVGQLQKQYEEVQKALQTLKATPEDAEANLAAGAWYAFVKDDWKTGLPYLAKGSDPLLKSLAGREVSSPPATPEDRLKLADAWWDAAAERRGEQQAAMLRTAGHWYEQAIGQLQGINKTKAEKRLSQIAELAQDTPSRPGREPPPAIAPFDAKRARGYQLQWARYLKVPVEFTNSIGMKFVLIPPGESDMGTTEQEVERLRKQAKQRALPDWHTSKLPSEAPQHRVKITRAYYLSLCEVTQAQYARVIASNPSEFKVSGPDAPVDNVSWNEAVAFCRRLSEFGTGKVPAGEYRLPTEAEWECACRAGTTAAFCFGDDESVLSDYAWAGKNADGKTRPVGQRKPNQFGLYDMHGNVWEWCADVFSADYYRQSPPADPSGPTTGSIRVLRGGYAGDSFADGFRCAIRNRFGQDGRDRSFGFRVARSISASTTTPKETKRPAKAASRMTPLNPAAVRAFKTLEGHEAPVLGLSFSPDGRLLASASADKTVRLWDTGTWEPVRTLSGHDGPVQKLAFTPDGRTLVSASDDKTARVWNVESGELVRKFEGHRDRVYCVAISPDGSLAATGSHDKTTKLWNLATGELCPVQPGAESIVHGLAFSPDGSALAVADQGAPGSSGNWVRLWDAKTGKLRWEYKHLCNLLSVAFSPDGSAVAASALDNLVRLLDARTGREQIALSGHSKPISSVAFKR